MCRFLAVGTQESSHMGILVFKLTTLAYNLLCGGGGGGGGQRGAKTGTSGRGCCVLRV